MIRALSLTLALCATSVRAEAPVLTFPLDCTLGDSCFVQNYMDRDPGPRAADFTCGPLTYDGHKGTDIALNSLAMMIEGVDVYAAAPGRITATRDGMVDIDFTDANAPDVSGTECGNGVVIEHADGYETQYCHMKNGSIAVAQGQSVTSGDLLGQVGLSGKTQFPHLHVSLRQNGRQLDPFRPAEQEVCTDASPGNLWQGDLGYVPGGLITAGFSPALPEYAQITAGTAGVSSIAPNAEALVIWAYMFGGRQGDILQFDYSGPGVISLTRKVTLEKTQAQLFRATGKRRRGANWSEGPINGTIRLIRDGKEIDRMDLSARIGP